MSELWRGAWVIYRKHMHKFVRNTTELGGTLAAPLLLAVTFGVGMQGHCQSSGDRRDELSVVYHPWHFGFTALSGAVNSGMTILEEKIRGFSSSTSWPLSRA